MSIFLQTSRLGFFTTEKSTAFQNDKDDWNSEMNAGLLGVVM